MATTELVEAEGHLIDSGHLSGIFDKVIELNASYEVLDFDIGQNLILRRHDRPPFSRRGVMNFGAVERHAVDLVKQFDVRAPSVRSRVRTLSGGARRSSTSPRSSRRCSG
jgi:hypothetical protein